MMKPLETDRLILRTLKEDDLNAIKQIAFT